ncbi:MAG: HsdR family type I site-specific deoxyribonuclease [Chloroflexota bacterium]|nr:HsdR family type I site-specific deoxyribonuclease [Chloroflexota bacterium]
MVGQIERSAQRRVVEFFQNALGYEYLGDWQRREGNANIEKDLLTGWLKRRGYDDDTIARALFRLERAAAVGGGRALFDANHEVYGLLRYGVRVSPDVGENNVTVRLIDWDDPDSNDFAIAEEVTVRGENNRRPDIVLYVNGIALGVLELKRSTVSVSEGIRQSISAQEAEFIRPFYATVQLLMAGNESEGLRYAVIETPERKWLRWKENVEHPDDGGSPLLRELWQLWRRERILDLFYNFIAFDSGEKKAARPNQYFGVRAAQEYARRREGGIIWHTQGSGKSLTMVWLARWIRENITDSRVLIITDRTELDEQIEGVFQGVEEDVHRTRSGADLLDALNDGGKWLIASLIHKFGVSDDEATDEYIADLRQRMPALNRPHDVFFVFVDECHRTQSGKLHRAMKSLLPDATFIGFTGTPLLRADKPRSVETFGAYIHTYRYDEAVDDGVVLDLRYEARDIDQSITSQTRIDEWFDGKTRELNDLAKARLKQRWGTMQGLFSSAERLRKIAADIMFDMMMRDRLQSGNGNALLVTDSIYSACRIFDVLNDTELKGRCAVVTSYSPTPGSVTGEYTGEGRTERLLQNNVYRKMLSTHFAEPEDTAIHKVDLFEKQVKEKFVNEPARMKLLIVVDKLLTGFDAPPATYLYIDKPMQDHGLFQAICRVNRIDTDDKEYGYIVDYRDLFKSLERSISDYTVGAFKEYDPEDIEGLLKDRLAQSRARLDKVREKIKALCEPVDPPYNTAAYIRYFCGGDGEDTKRKRLALYRLTASFVRAYANIANEMREAGYSQEEAQTIKREVAEYEAVRQEVKLASGDYIDLKMYEPAMRHLLDTYIRAEESETLSTFDDMTLVDMLAQTGAGAVDALPDSIRDDPVAASETIANNIRRVIVDKSALNPMYYSNMSSLLDALVQQRRIDAIEYKEYLRQAADLAKKVKEGDGDYPARIDKPGLRALYDNLPDDGADWRERTALGLHEAIQSSARDAWRGSVMKERAVENAIRATLSDRPELIDAIFEIVKAQSEY